MPARTAANPAPIDAVAWSERPSVRAAGRSRRPDQARNTRTEERFDRDDVAESSRPSTRAEEPLGGGGGRAYHATEKTLVVMAYRFRYRAPRVTDLTVYALALAGVAWGFERGGPQLWAALAGRFSSLEIVVGLGFALYMTVFWVLGGTYLWFDAVRDRAAASVRRGDEPGRLGAFLLRWEIQRPPAPQDRRAPDVDARQAVAVVLRNQFLGTLPALFVFHHALAVRGVDFSAPPPGALTLVWQLGVFVLVEEVLFYTVHRTLHRRDLFRRIHRIHHEYRKSTGIATHYVHYLEHLIGNLLPVFTGVVWVAAHPLVAFVWVSLAVTNAIHTHGGYAFPGMSYALDHDFHHYRLRGNYGVLGLLDAVLRTNREFVELDPDDTI